jgi:hypothetical protein
MKTHQFSENCGNERVMVSGSRTLGALTASRRVGVKSFAKNEKAARGGDGASSLKNWYKPTAILASNQQRSVWESEGKSSCTVTDHLFSRG